MDPRDRARELGQGAGTKPVEEDDPREKLRDRSGRAGPFRREDLPPVEEPTRASRNARRAITSLVP